MVYDHVVGIDLGTTNTLACYFVKGKKKLLKFAPSGDTMLPSVIFTDETGRIFVGQKAENLGENQPENMIRSAKTYIGNFELNKTWTCNNHTYTPTDVATEVLKEVRRELVKRLRLADNEKIGAIITVPAYFNDNQRDETRKAGAAAGFEVMWILEEPTAAAIEAVHEKELDKKVFVVDIGGGTFDLSVLEADHENHTYKAIAIDGDDRLGGDDFDKLIRKELIRHIEDDTGIKLSDPAHAGLEDSEYKKLMNRLLLEARHAKEELSDLSEHRINLPNLTTLGGKNYELDFILTRKALEKICMSLFDRIFNQLLDFARSNNNFKLEEIGHIILAGGTCFIPYIRERIAQELGIMPDDELPLGQLVVIGAARVAEAKNGGLEGGINLKSILPHSLGIEVMNNDGQLVFDKILAKDTPYPCKSTPQEYKTTYDNQTEIEVNVYEAGKEGESDLNFHRFRGMLTLDDLPAAPKGETKVDIIFEYMENQTLKVTAIDKENPDNSVEKTLDKTTKAATHSGAVPIDMVLLLDSSGSMGGNDMVQAKQAAKNLITKMIDFKVHRMALISFNDVPKVLCEFTDDPERLVKVLSYIRAANGTNMVKALKAAANELEHSERKKIVLMVTDGYPDSDSQLTTLKFAQNIRNEGIKIIAIGVGNIFDKNFLDRMVGSENAFTIDNMSELTAQFEWIINALTRGNL